MDTNSNKKEDLNMSKKRVNMASVVMFLIIAAITVISVCSFKPITEKVYKENYNLERYITSSRFNYELSNITRYLLDNEEESWLHRDYQNIESIKYYVSREGEIFSSNLTDASKESIQQQKDNSIFYVKIQVEPNKVQIEKSSGGEFNSNLFLEYLNNNDVNINEYSGLEIVYIIPDNFLNYRDYITNQAKQVYINLYAPLILIIGLMGAFILSIIAIVTKYSVQEKIGICRGFNKVFLELKVMIIAIAFSVCILLVEQIWGINGLNDIIYNVDSRFYFIGIPITFIIYLFVYLTVVYTKSIYHKGFMQGVVQNSIIGRVCRYIAIKFIDFIKDIISIDITENYNKKFFIILAVNLLILITIALLREFGIIVAIIYTVFLFRYLLKMINKVKELNEASSELALGNVDVNFNEDKGLLSPIYKNLNNIKTGFKVAVDKAIISQRMKTELISNVSHDLKTPLTSIITYVDLLKDENIEDDTKKQYIDILDKKSKRLKSLIEDLFEASKANSGNIEIQLEELDIIALFRQTLGELEEKMKKTTLKIKLNIPENKIICKLDGKKTYRILDNIMSNIIKYSMENSRVYIDVEEQEEKVSFIFKNISAYEMNFDAEEITERFTRGDKSRNTEGSGLGLAIAKSLIELQEGEIKISIDGDLFKLIATFPKMKN